MKILLVILLCLFLLGCGDIMKIHTFEVNQYYLDQLCDESYKCEGYTIWDWYTMTCFIFVLPRDEVDFPEDYDNMLEHEKDHCFKGEYH